MYDKTNCVHCNSNNIEQITTQFNKGYVCLDCGHKYHHYDTRICCDNQDRVNIQFEQANGSYVQRVACINCKSLIGGAVKKDANFSSYKKLTQARFLEVEDIKNKDSDLFSALQCKAYENFKTLSHDEWLEQHNLYLNSVEWKALRLRVLERDKNLCQACLIYQATQVHHKTYKNWMNEPAFELISVCKLCHDKIHEKQ